MRLAAWTFKTHQTNLWALNAIVASVAVLVAATAGMIFILTRSFWVIIAFVVLEIALYSLHIHLTYRLVRQQKTK
jgi:hypothetical protein